MILFIIPSFGTAAENAGFVDGIWFSKQDVTEGETIQIFVAVQNQTNATINGHVVFLDGSSEIGVSAFSVASNAVGSVSISYILGAGTHSISARITPSQNSTPTYTTLPVRTIFAKAKPVTSEQLQLQSVKESVLSILPSLPNLDLSKVPSSTTVQTMARTAGDVAKTSGNVASALFNKIDPKAKGIAETLRKKGKELRNKQEVTSINTETLPITSTQAGQNPAKLKQFAAVGLSALAFVFSHWLWHLVVASSLIILRAIYRRRIF